MSLKQGYFFFLLFILLGTSSCKGVRVERGEVPDQYRAMAETYMGSYAGPNGILHVALAGRVVTLSYSDRAGHTADLLDPRCESRIGRLQSVSLAPNGALQSADFAFDPNRCWGSVDGRSLKLDFASGRVRTSILIRGPSAAAAADCRIAAGSPRTAITPHQSCATDRAVTSSKMFRR